MLRNVSSRVWATAGARPSAGPASRRRPRAPGGPRRKRDCAGERQPGGKCEGHRLAPERVDGPDCRRIDGRKCAEQDAAETEKNKNWDPNAPLSAKPGQRASGVVSPGAPAATPAPAAPVAAVPKAYAPASTRDAAAILGEIVRAHG